MSSESEPKEDDDDELLDSDRRDRRGKTGRAASTRNSKRDSQLKDQQSTGRKRAAKLYPLDPELPCEWQGRSNCGGGSTGILGCIQGKQQARHHGPDKNVTNNEQGNVHRICHACHNRWHTKNDKTYNWNATVYPAHSPVLMSDKEREEAAMIELKYLANKSARSVIKD